MFSIGAPVLITVLNIDALTEDGNIEFFWIICFLFGMALIPNAYAFSYLFKSTAGVLIYYILISLISSLIAPPLIIFLTFAGSRFYYWTRNISFCMRLLFPMYCFGDSLFKMVFRPVLTTILQETELISIWDRRAAGDNAWFLIGQIVFYWLVIIIVEHSTHIKKITNLFL